jgi:hypothetical protein
MKTIESYDPREHSRNIREALEEITGHTCDDTRKVSDHKAPALFETSAEVLSGLAKAFEHFEGKTEGAWK